MLKYKHGAIRNRLHSLNTTKSGFFWYKSCSANNNPTQIKNPLNQNLAFMLFAGGLIKTINANKIKQPAANE
jgi:hypothetical protein